MSNIDKQALREVAEKVTQGPWKVFSDIDTKTFSIHTPRDKRCENVIKWVGLIVSRMLRPTLNLLLHLTRKSRWRCWMRIFNSCGKRRNRGCSACAA